MIDVLIAGGGIAGAALAMGLAQRGFSVEVFERANFPREKLCGEGLMPAGVAALERLGVPVPRDAAEFLGIRYRGGAHSAEGRFPRVGAMPQTGQGIRRRDLDYLLAQRAASTPGVTFHTGSRVDGLLVDDRRVIGLVVEGQPRRAMLVVAADGAQSRLRHALGLDTPVRRKRVGMRAHFRLAAGQPVTPWVEVFLGRGHELYVTPLPRGELLIAALAEADALRGPVERQYHRWIEEQRALVERLEGAEQISEFAATSPLSGRAKRRVLPGFVLLGDAAGFTDPITGGGMTQALVAAEMLSKHAARAFGSGVAWLEAFDRERETWLRDYRRLTAMILWLSRRPTLIPAALRVAQRVPQLFSHLLGVSGGTRRLGGGELPQESPSAGARRSFAPVLMEEQE
jgi:flavin-dependent dehydrogenase